MVPRDTRPGSALTLIIDEAQLGVLYPAFVRTDAEDRILSFGSAIARHVKAARAGAAWSDVFDIAYDLPEHSGRTSDTPRDILRIVSHEAGIEFTGCRIGQQDGSIYLLVLCPSGLRGTYEGPFMLSDFPPSDSRVPHMVVLSLHRALLAEAQEVVEQLARARDVAVAALQTQTDFLTGVSHELRTPLFSISGYSEILAETAGADSLDLALRLRDAARQLEHKLNNLLDYAALRAGRIEVEPATVRIDQLMAELDPLEALAHRKGFGFSITRGPGVPDTVTVSPKLFVQALENLVQNAIIFTASGTVAVELSLSAADRLRVVVRDTGPGMSADISGRIFEGFCGIGYRTTDQAAGLGLGLAVCREIATLLNGGIGVLDAPPGGAAPSGLKSR